MSWPTLTDTIVALSSGRSPSAIGIVRLSGPSSFTLARNICSDTRLRTTPDRPIGFDTEIEYADLEGRIGPLPARLLAFAGPRSFTGQDVIEIHTMGCLPLLDALVAHFVGLGARAAQPGEFSARAFLNRKIDARQVEGILGLIQAQSQVAASDAARRAQGRSNRAVDAIRSEILDLLSRVEAGIDFVEEEDIRFVTAPEAAAAIDDWLRRLPKDVDAGIQRIPHVALVGLPNAGKSTLFNALVGRERAIVSPEAGTTRDVISAEVTVEGLRIVLQDSAGKAAGRDPIDELAGEMARLATSTADIAVWVHDRSTAWHAAELELCQALAKDRRILVLSKGDLGVSPKISVPIEFAAVCEVTAKQVDSLASMRQLIAKCVEQCSPTGSSDVATLRRFLQLARFQVDEKKEKIPQPELLASELRSAHEMGAASAPHATDEQILDVIFSRFCIGK